MLALLIPHRPVCNRQDQVIASVRRAAVVGDLNVVPQLRRDNLAAVDLLERPDGTIEAQISDVGPDGIDLQPLAVKTLLAEDGDADRTEYNPASFKERRAGGEDHAFGIQLQLDGPFQFIRIRPIRLDQLLHDPGAMGRQGRDDAVAFLPELLGQSRQTVNDADVAMGIADVARAKPENAEHQERNPSRRPHGEPPLSALSKSPQSSLPQPAAQARAFSKTPVLACGLRK